MALTFKASLSGDMTIIEDEGGFPVLMVPAHSFQGLLDYLRYGHCGGFLGAVLSNDLTESVGRADHVNAKFLQQIVWFLYNYFPREAFGNEQIVANWQDRTAEQRESVFAAWWQYRWTNPMPKSDIIREDLPENDHAEEAPCN